MPSMVARMSEKSRLIMPGVVMMSLMPCTACIRMSSARRNASKKLVPRGTSFFEAFRLADDILMQAVQGISDIITTPGMINRDFSDIRATMLGMGYAMMGTAVGRGANAAVEAARRAISSPLLE